jgi:FkbM family methyltransferase
VPTPGPSFSQRLARFLSLLPEAVSNNLRFRTRYVLARTFRMPDRVRVAGRSVALRFPDEEGVDADFLECFVHNAYGLRRGLGEVRTILDVGANVGFFSLAARGHYPRAAIHAYEPNPRVVPFLRDNTAGFGVTIHPEAVGRDDAMVAMIDAGPSNEARTRPSDDPGRGIRQVSLRTAIERIGGAVDLLKLDCEGAEWEILSPDACWRSVRAVRVEYHLLDGHTARDAAGALRACGFDVVRRRYSHECGGVMWGRRS